MTLILTNDDGIDAPGLRALKAAFNQPVITVAPLRPQSGCGHQITTHQPIAVQQRSPREYAVDGTPADCARIAITQLVPDASWMLSGINAGGNLGVDVYISGTVAAVREAAMHGIPGIALSHWICRPLVLDWERASQWAAKTIARLQGQPLPPKSFWNVNFPHLTPDRPEPEIIFCQPCTQPLPVKYRIADGRYHYEGEYHLRDRLAGTDVDACFSGNIAVTSISL